MRFAIFTGEKIGIKIFRVVPSYHSVGSYVRVNRLCGLVVRVPGYRLRGPGFDPGDIRFLEK
jgi:hypothetical protein